MPRVRRGPEGPRTGAGGVGATNKPTPHPSASTSAPTKSNLTPPPTGTYSNTDRRKSSGKY